ncbi:MAG: ATP-binding protein [Oscillospiraceae bacterium]|nr:ATP-binding protein [Oscillospiraceae bacterium]
MWSNIIYIIDNAVKHSPQGCIIRVNITNTEDTVLVCVADNVKGMSEDVLRHIFEKFSGRQLPKSRGELLGACSRETYRRSVQTTVCTSLFNFQPVKASK